MPRYIVSSDTPITARAIAGHPDQGLPWPERPTDPDYGVELPEVEPPEPPPGIWPGPTPGHPLPLPPDVSIPPGAVWPPINASGKYVVAFAVIGNGVRKIHYTVVDGSAIWPDPGYGVEGPPPAQPKPAG